MLLIMKLLLIIRALNGKSLSFFHTPLSALHNNSSTVHTITPFNHALIDVKMWNKSNRHEVG